METRRRSTERDDMSDKDNPFGDMGGQRGGQYSTNVSFGSA